MTALEEATKPVFLYDDCCPLCRGYTASFTALGWADREAFSSIDDQTFEALDFDRARHQIPLHDRASGTTAYGLDGILRVVGAEAPFLRPIIERPLARRLLDGFYWFITYNRRHIVTEPPPAAGVDCAPDFEPEPVAAYLGFCGAAATGLAIASGAPLAVGAATVAGAALMGNRSPERNLNPMQAAGHAGSVAVAAGFAGALTNALTRRPALAAAAITATAARKLWLRRWVRNPPPAT